MWTRLVACHCRSLAANWAVPEPLQDLLTHAQATSTHRTPPSLQARAQRPVHARVQARLSGRLSGVQIGAHWWGARSQERGGGPSRRATPLLPTLWPSRVLVLWINLGAPGGHVGDVHLHRSARGCRSSSHNCACCRPCFLLPAPCCLPAASPCHASAPRSATPQFCGAMHVMTCRVSERVGDLGREGGRRRIRRPARRPERVQVAG
jgi:hypothetical protein